MDNRGSETPGCFSVAHVVSLGLVLMYWGIAVRMHPCDASGCAYVNVSAVASFVASGCVMLAAVMNWPKLLLVAAMGASVVAVGAAFAVGWGIILPVLTIMLTVLPIWLLLTWWTD